MFDHLNSEDYISCAIGIAVLIAWIFKKEGDKYEHKTKPFVASEYFSKNVFDFIFYIIGGFGMLIIAGEVVDNNPDFFEKVGMNSGGTYHFVISLGAGLLGGMIIESVLGRIKK